MRSGIDTSHWQYPGDRPIDWQRVAGAGIRWAAIKLTEGTTFVDPWASRDIPAAKAAGIEVVAYHFARPTRSTADAEVDHFMSELWKVGGTDAAALDVEDGRQMGWAQLGAWVDRFIARKGCQLIYYSQDYRRNLARHLHLGDVREWVAAPSLSSPPAGAIVWQRGQAAIPGISGAVDVDTVYYERQGRPDAPAGAPHAAAAPLPAVEPVLHRGDSGDAVRYLQGLLNNHGARLAVDGIFGDATRAAVKAFQRGAHILDDGWVGRTTWARLGAQ